MSIPALAEDAAQNTAKAAQMIVLMCQSQVVPAESAGCQIRDAVKKKRPRVHFEGKIRPEASYLRRSSTARIGFFA
ncbi:hypothetical protein RB2654_19768 [Maritimibacter alkaliphilus HTCC2654]|uniref:Uncharacterized protein n=1 Tax=Maritimibacter alkaliphilus HTCC2654 TaxID=314271 RepID=A3VAB4_9RHOB|nr:hypothetical protein RB2654_19768 [Maritimibacter alkaliphilus HTCC2654]